MRNLFTASLKGIRDFKSERKYVNTINYSSRMTRRAEATNEEQTNLACVSVVIFSVTHYSVTYRCLPGTLMSVKICMNELKVKNFFKQYHKLDEYNYILCSNIPLVTYN